MTVREALVALAAQLPADACIPVPVALLRELFTPATPAPMLSADLSAAQVGALLGWRPSTIRGWAEQGRFPLAYKLGHAWRIPPASIAAFQAAAAGQGGPVVPLSASSSTTPVYDALRRRRRAPQLKETPP